MNVQTIKGTVQSHTKKPFQLDNGTTMMDNSITVHTDKGNVVLKKYTLSSTDFELVAGTQVEATYDAVKKTGSKGDYILNKIIKDGLVILSGESKATSTPTSHTVIGVTTSSSDKFITGSKPSYDSNGARNGMIAGKAVELAIARGDLRLEGLKIAASDVLALTFFVESGAKLEARVIEPKKETKKKVEKTVEISEDEDSFEFDE